MGIGVSLVLVAVGAILRFATTASVSGFNVQTVGLILIIVGAVGFVISLIFWGSWGGFGGMTGYSRRRTVVRQGSQYGDPHAQHTYDAGGEVVTRVEENQVI
jgi:hypothetical protein